jgi:hypothetical protein
MVQGQHDQVRVRHTKAVHDHAHSFGFGEVAQHAREALTDDHDVGRQIVRQVAEVIDVLFRDDEQLAFTHGADVQESQDVIVLVNATGGSLPAHDFAEDAAHRETLTAKKTLRGERKQSTLHEKSVPFWTYPHLLRRQQARLATAASSPQAGCFPIVIVIVGVLVLVLGCSTPYRMAVESKLTAFVWLQ